MDSKGKMRVIAFLLMLFVVCEASKNLESGYIFTCPKGIKIGMNNELQLFLIGTAARVKILATLTCDDKNNTLVQTKEFAFKDKKHHHILDFFVPSIDTNYCYSGIMKISGTIAGKRVSGNDTVYLRHAKQSLIFIQTDKPMYKPGQEAKLRVLAMDKNLKPIGNKRDNAQIFVEDSKGMRLYQFDDVDLSKGMIQRKFQISDEPADGIWKITVMRSSETESTTFEVKKYKLPKFEVKIIFPPFTIANAEILSYQVCSTYTYGQPVNGICNVNISRQSYYPSEKMPVVEKSVKIEGCHNFTQNLSMINADDSFRYRQIQVVANCIEDGTGVQINKTEFYQLQYTPLYINFVTDQNYKQYIKPGLPFNGKLKVTNPDQTPAADEPVELCATISRETVLCNWLATRQEKYCRNYTSDCDGYVTYSMYPQSNDIVSVQLEVTSLKYAKHPQNSGSTTDIINTPNAALHLTPFSSPSESFVQLKIIGGTVPCGIRKNMEVFFTAKGETEFTLIYQISNRGRVLKTGSKRVYFNPKDNVSEDCENEDELIQGSGIQIVPDAKRKSSSKRDYSDDDDSCQGVKDTDSLPYIGVVTIPVDIHPSMSPNFNIIVFYVRNNREVVADSQKIEVEKCFKNKVSFEFGDEVKQPGTNTSIIVNSSPNSYCGLKVVDKSLLLLNSNHELTKEKIFAALNSLDIGYYYSTDPCSEKIRQPGLISHRGKRRFLPPHSNKFSKVADSSDAFENNGWIYISNLIIVSRTCTKNNGNIFPVGVHSVAFKSAVRADRRDVAFDAEMAGSGASNTVSAVPVRYNFGETWLFEIQQTGPDGAYAAEKTLPHTITEWVGSAVCINSVDGLGLSNTATMKGFQAFFMSFTLPIIVIQGEKFVVTVSLFSYIKGKCVCVSVTVLESLQFSITNNGVSGVVCILPGKPETRQMTLEAIKTGNVSLTVTAETSYNDDSCGSYPIYEGWSKDAVRQPIEVDAQGFPVVETFNILFCPKDEPDQTFVYNFPLYLPNKVVSDSARATVETSGNIMGPAIHNLDNMVLMPTGCGEQNMAKFATNVVVLDYLNSINQLPEGIRQRAIRNLNEGYQRQLNYRRHDGSFSAFGNSDKEGSSFLTLFVHLWFCKAKSYINIDPSIMSGCEKWIFDQQQPDGGIPDRGKIVDYGFEGGVDDKNSTVNLAAYAAIALNTCGIKNKTALDALLSYIENAEETEDAYQNVICAYAQALAGRKEEAMKHIDRIRPRANITDGVEYYSYPNGPKSLEMETAGYRILESLQRGQQPSDISGFIRYLTSNMNHQGGFQSTQDTVVGLSALSSFGKKVYKEPVDMKVTFSNTKSEVIQINEQNKLLLQREKVLEVPGEVKVRATGDGCAFLQAILRYNVMSPPEKQSFHLDINGECTSTDGQEGKITVTVSAKKSAEKCGMCVLKLTMVSGYFPKKESLDKLTSDKNNGIARWDNDKNVYFIYFREIAIDGERFSLEVLQDMKIENPQPGTAEVYCYYRPELKTMMDYHLLNCNVSKTLYVPDSTKL